MTLVMSKIKCGLSIALAFFCCMTVALNRADCKLLEGALQQTDTLPALPDRFQVARPFSEDMLGQPDNLLEWVMIPSVLAGTWSRNGTILLSVRDELTHKETHPNSQSFPHGSFTRGFQMDANGNIWDCPRGRRHRFETSGDGRSAEYIIITGGRQMLVTGPDSLRDFGEVTIVDVDLATRLITRVQRSVQVVIRRVVQDGVVQVDSTTGSYTPEGKLLSTSIDRSFEKRIADFSRMDTLDGLNLRKGFEDFFKQQQQQQQNR
jgi:hypothetical protein